ncbi:MAG: hypothetical protein N4A50_08340 [Vallitalea sp.]|jgi:hypothetical protein|nr:hypothetical protein [Vallitalea sp.]
MEIQDSIYYYTSTYVLEEWFNSEKIWATRSITSNDYKDTSYIIEKFLDIESYFEKLNCKENIFSNEEIEKMFKEANNLIKYSKYVSQRTLKDLWMYVSIKQPMKQ